MFSFEKESPADNLLQLWIAFEFLCSRERVPTLVDKKYLKDAINSINKLSIPELEKEAIIQSVKDVNDAPLMIKWNYLLNRLRIRLAKGEEELIGKLRSDRNKIIHGDKDVASSFDEIEKFRSILERVFLAKTNDTSARRGNVIVSA